MIIAVDFDGTITKKNAYPAVGEVNEPVVDALKWLQSEGHQLILWTCRTNSDLDVAIHVCKERGLEFQAINTNVPEIEERGWGSGRKIYADVYFDDKGVNGITEVIRQIVRSE